MPAAMANLMGELWDAGTPDWAAACADPDVKMHLYGKRQPRPGRKMGHLTTLANSSQIAMQRVLAARAALDSAKAPCSVNFLQPPASCCLRFIRRQRSTEQFPLRSSERVSICWHNEGSWFEIADDRAPISLGKIPPYFGNGAVVYKPTRAGDSTLLNNAAVDRTADEVAVLRPKNPDRAAALIYRLHCPYILSDVSVRGDYADAASGAVRLSISFDEGQRWTEVWRSAQ